MIDKMQVYRDPKEGPCGREFHEKSDADAIIAEKDRALEFAKALTLKDIETIEKKDKEIAELKAKLAAAKENRRAHVPGQRGGIRMKTIFRITAIFNLLLVIIAFICAVMATINKDGSFLVASALTTLVSIFPAAMMLALCNDFKETDK